MSDIQAYRSKKTIAWRFTSSSMSDSKWRKLLILLSTFSMVSSGYHWKFVDNDHIYFTSIPGPGDIAESHLVDGSFQPFIYEEIEWLAVKTADPSLLLSTIERTGNFDCQASAESIRFYGYR